jgi:hypothetical protein
MTRQIENLKVSKKRIFFVTLGILILISPCAFCWWIAFGANEFFRIRLPVYPNARQISDAYGFIGANTGIQRIYFWTSDSSDAILKYYESFTYPFIQDNENPARHRTAFNPSGELLPVVTAEFGGEILDLGQNRVCYYPVHYQCVEVEIIDFGDEQPIVLVGVQGRTGRTPMPPPADLKGGRLIIYTYYVGDGS